MPTYVATKRVGPSATEKTTNRPVRLQKDTNEEGIEDPQLIMS